MSKRKNAILILTVVSLLLLSVIGVSIIIHIEKKIEEKSYPLEYYEIVEQNSSDFGVPMNIIFGVILTESAFDSDAVSKTGAMGLMQIMPETFADLQGRLGDEYSDDKLFDPEVNIRYGSYYLSYLYDIFGDWEITFAAYNGGMGNVKKWLADDRYSKDGVLVSIPFDETREYVKKVASAAEKYKDIIYKTEEED